MPELDSMSVLELVAVLEERFAIQISDDEITGLRKHRQSCGVRRA